MNGIDALARQWGLRRRHGFLVFHESDEKLRRRVQQAIHDSLGIKDPLFEVPTRLERVGQTLKKWVL